MTLGALIVGFAAALGVGAAASGRHRLTHAATLALMIAVGLLAIDFATEDWGNAYVVSTTRSGLSLPVRMAGLWGGAEGSLLLFTALVSLAASIVAFLGGAQRALSALAAAYAVVVLVVADPFERFDAPAAGGLGLQPVLEHPAMTWHPPILYLGLVGVMAPGFLAVGGVGDRRLRRARGVSLALLTAGLATGAAWAHAELGWGGFWAWDPIESAGLVAWLAAAGAQHLRFSAVDRRIAALVLLPALAAVWATTLTRAGLTQSVHSFADRPGLRAGLLIVAVGWSGVLGWTVFGASGSPVHDKRQPRVWAAGLLLLTTAVIAIGTYEPAVEQAVGGDSVGLDPTFFTRLVWPLVITGAALVVKADRAFVPAAIGALCGLAITPFSAGFFGLAVAIGGGAVAGSALGGVARGRPGWLAHVGVGVLLVGVGGTMAATTADAILVKDRPSQVSGLSVVHRGIELQSTTSTDAAIATIEVDGVMLRPALVAHRLRNIPTSEMATQRGWLNQTQVVLADGSDGQADYRINRTPRLNLVWLGAILTAIGSLDYRRLRLGVGSVRS